MITTLFKSDQEYSIGINMDSWKDGRKFDGIYFKCDGNDIFISRECLILFLKYIKDKDNA